MSCGVGHRCSLDPTLLWLWCRLAATALIRPPAWELPNAAGVALKKRKKTKKKKKRKKKIIIFIRGHKGLNICALCWRKIVQASYYQNKNVRNSNNKSTSEKGLTLTDRAKTIMYISSLKSHHYFVSFFQTDLKPPLWVATFRHKNVESACGGSAEMNLTSIHKDAGSIPDLAQWLRTQRCWELWCRSQMRLGSCVAVAMV